MSWINLHALPSVDRPRVSGRAALIGHGLLIAGAAAGATYAIHHLPLIDGHSFGQMLVATALAVWVTVTLVNRTPIAPRAGREVIVIGSDHEPCIEELTPRDVKFSAELHHAALSHGFLPMLGEGFLRQYHRAFIASPHAEVYRATLAGHSVGFLLGVIDTRSNSRWILRHRGFRLAASGIRALITRPTIAAMFVRTRIRSYAAKWRSHRRRDGDPIPFAEDPPAVVSHVAVVPGARGYGIGGALLEAFEGDVARAGIREVRLATLDGPGGAGEFYRRRGWSLVGAKGEYPARVTIWQRHVAKGE